MRDILTGIFENQPFDPREAVRRGARAALRKRFFVKAHAGEGEAGNIPLLLDGKTVKTPARRALEAPTRTLAEKIAEEWNAQTEVVDLARMPVTRLANAIIDAVANRPEAVAAEVAKYLSADLLCYRAGEPEGLVARQSERWDPPLAWARESMNARFVLGQGVMHVTQPEEAIAAARAKIPADPSDVGQIWRLGAISSITTLTGSALLALALAAGAIESDAAWAAAHVDEDWQMSQWGRDELALERRAFREAEFRAAVTVLRLSH